jgi:WD40 repeat protein
MNEDNGRRDSPYQGLAPYDEGDAAFFFGRDRERDLITANLMASRLTVLYGVSGVGKSSVLRAGAAHHLHALAHQNRTEFGRPLLSLAVFNGWSTWRDDLSTGVVHAVRAAVGDALGGEAPATVTDELLPTLEAATEAVDGDVMLVLDQFEEYFVYQPNDTGAESFAEEFVAMVNATSLPVSVLVSIREDSIGQLRLFKGRIPHLLDATLHVDHLDPAAARAAIVDPVRTYNELYGDSVDIEPELVDAVLADLLEGTGSKTNGRDEIETPYLQLVMTNLWDEERRLGSQVLRVETLKRLGQGKAILRNHLAARMSELTRSEQSIAARFFYHLVTPSGTKIGHAVGDLAAFADVPVKRLRPVLERLARPGTWILRGSAPAPGQAGGTRYEIFHDLLAMPILEWRARYRTERDRRRLRWAAVAVGTLVLLALATIGVAIVQTRAANDDSDDRNLIASLPAADVVNRAEFSRDGELAVGAIDNGEAVIWSTDSGKPVAVLKGHSGPVTSAVFGDRDAAGVTASVDGTARTWDVKTGSRRDLLRSRGPVNTAGFSPDGDFVVTASDDGTARVFTAAGNPKFEFRPGGTVNSATFDRTGTRIVTASSDGSVTVWSVTRGTKLASLVPKHNGPVLRASFSPNGEAVITAGADRTARIWSWEIGAVKVLRGHEGAITSASYNNRDPNLVVTGSEDRTARVWSVRTGTTVVVLAGHAGAITRAVFGQQGHIVATASDDGTARIWTLDGEQQEVLSGHAGPVLSISLDLPGFRALTAGSDGSARLYRVPCYLPNRSECPSG